MYEIDEPFYKWYPDGLINACYTSLDIHVIEGRGEQIAIIDLHPKTHEITNYTYNDLYQRCGRLATSLSTRFNLKQGDRAILLTYNHIDALVMTLACARLGVIFQMVLHVNTALELSNKINELEPKIIFTVS